MISFSRVNFLPSNSQVGIGGTICFIIVWLLHSLEWTELSELAGESQVNILYLSASCSGLSQKNFRKIYKIYYLRSGTWLQQISTRALTRLVPSLNISTVELMNTKWTNWQLRQHWSLDLDTGGRVNWRTSPDTQLRGCQYQCNVFLYYLHIALIT